jgi:hypothetical protein
LCAATPRRSKRRALREYGAAAAAARASAKAGNAVAGPLLAQALYSEAWMRAHGEGCEVGLALFTHSTCVPSSRLRVGTFHHVILQSKHIQFMTAKKSM